MGKPHRRVSFWGLVWDGARETTGTWATILALILTFLVWRFAQGCNVPLWIATLIGTLMLLLIIALVQAIRNATGLISFGSTQVVDVLKPHVPYMNCKCICLIEPAETLLIGTSVSFHWIEKNYERPLGWGTVIHEQDDGRVVVTIHQTHLGEEVEAFVRRLVQGEKSAIECLRARVAVSLPFGPETKEEASVGSDPTGPRLSGSSDSALLTSGSAAQLTKKSEG